MGLRKLPVGVRMHGQALACVEELHEQHAVVPVPGNVLGSQPNFGCTRDGICKEFAGFQPSHSFGCFASDARG
jgi:hypothetical protein